MSVIGLGWWRRRRDRRVALDPALCTLDNILIGTIYGMNFEVMPPLLARALRDGDWDIYVMQDNGSQVRQLVDAPGLDDKPRWIPDGSRVAFATTRHGYPELFAVDPATREAGPLLAQPVRGINPSWSHDGDQLAFNVVTSRGFDIDVMTADGKGRRSVIAGAASEERPRWSPDGRQLAYYSDAAGSWDVYVVDVATRESRALTNTPGFDGQPEFQPS